MAVTGLSLLIPTATCEWLEAMSTDLEGLHEGPEKDSDGVALPQQLDESGGSEELQEAHVDGVQRLPMTMHKTMYYYRIRNEASAVNVWQPVVPAGPR